MIDWDLAHLPCAAQHDALHAQRRAGDDRPSQGRVSSVGDCAREISRTSRGATRQDKMMTRSLSLNTGLMVRRSATQSQVGIRRGHALRHPARLIAVARSGEALPYRLHTRRVRHERDTGGGFARRVVSLVGQVRVQH